MLHLVTKVLKIITQSLFIHVNQYSQTSNAVPINLPTKHTSTPPLDIITIKHEDSELWVKSLNDNNWVIQKKIVRKFMGN